ncbi:MAG: twin-arginine translocation signal domain-containing protein [Hyphomicrobiaceae bacterium]
MRQSDEKKSPASDRRSFLKLAGAGVVTTGAALVASSEATKAEAAAPADAAGGYRETDHVRRYYELARFI